MYFNLRIVLSHAEDIGNFLERSLLKKAHFNQLHVVSLQVFQCPQHFAAQQLHFFGVGSYVVNQIVQMQIVDSNHPVVLLLPEMFKAIPIFRNGFPISTLDPADKNPPPFAISTSP